MPGPASSRAGATGSGSAVGSDLQPRLLEVELAQEAVHRPDWRSCRSLRICSSASRCAPSTTLHRSAGRRASGPRSRRPRSCRRAPRSGACGTRTCARIRSTVSSRVHSSSARASSCSSAALVATSRACSSSSRPRCRRRSPRARRISAGSESPWTHQREEDHREGEEDDQVSLRERRRRRRWSAAGRGRPPARRRRASRSRPITSRQPALKRRARWDSVGGRSRGSGREIVKNQIEPGGHDHRGDRQRIAGKRAPPSSPRSASDDGA